MIQKRIDQTGNSEDATNNRAYAGQEMREGPEKNQMLTVGLADGRSLYGGGAHVSWFISPPPVPALANQLIGFSPAYCLIKGPRFPYWRQFQGSERLKQSYLLISVNFTIKGENSYKTNRPGRPSPRP